MVATPRIAAPGFACASDTRASGNPPPRIASTVSSRTPPFGQPNATPLPPPSATRAPLAEASARRDRTALPRPPSICTRRSASAANPRPAFWTACVIALASGATGVPAAALPIPTSSASRFCATAAPLAWTRPSNAICWPIRYVPASATRPAPPSVVRTVSAAMSALPPVAAAVPVKSIVPPTPAKVAPGVRAAPVLSVALPCQRSSAAERPTSRSATMRSACVVPQASRETRTGPVIVGFAASIRNFTVAASRSITHPPTSSLSLIAANVPRNPSSSLPEPASFNPTIPCGVSSRIRPSATDTSSAGNANGFPDGAGNSLSIAPSDTLPPTSRPRSRTFPARTPSRYGPDSLTPVRVSTQSATRSGCAGSPITTLVSRWPPSARSAMSYRAGTPALASSRSMNPSAIGFRTSHSTTSPAIRSSAIPSATRRAVAGRRGWAPGSAPVSLVSLTNALRHVPSLCIGGSEGVMQLPRDVLASQNGRSGRRR